MNIQRTGGVRPSQKSTPQRPPTTPSPTQSESQPSRDQFVAYGGATVVGLAGGYGGLLLGGNLGVSIGLITAPPDIGFMDALLRARAFGIAGAAIGTALAGTAAAVGTYQAIKYLQEG